MIDGLPLTCLLSQAPVTLMLQIAKDHVVTYDKLITAYGQIAKVLSRFDRLNAALKDDAGFQQLLALVYVDILAFHECAYKFFKRRGMATENHGLGPSRTPRSCHTVLSYKQ